MTKGCRYILKQQGVPEKDWPVFKSKDALATFLNQTPTLKTALETAPATISKTETVEQESNISVGEMLDKVGSYKGEKGTFVQDGQTIVFRSQEGNREYELGNIDEIRNAPISEFDITHEESVVGFDDDGNITVRGASYKNNYSDPLQAVNRDKDGNVVSVNLETADGKKRTFRGNIAEDIAYNIHLKEITKDNETRSEFEQFINEDAKATAEVNSGTVSTVTPTKPVENNAPVQREKIERKPIAKSNDSTSKTGTEVPGTDEDGKDGRQDAGKSSDKGGGSEPPKGEEVKPPKPPISDEDKKIADEAGKELSGIKKALVEESIVEDTVVEKRSAKEMLEQGQAALKSGKINGELLVKSINEKPRALQPIEVAAMVAYKVDIDNELREGYKNLDAAIKDGDGVAQLSAQAEIAKAEQKILEYQQMSVLTAYEQSLAFSLRKMLLDDQYTLQDQILKYKANNDGKIPAEVEAKMREQDKIIREANERIAELEKLKEEAEAREVIVNIQEDIERKKKTQKSATQKADELANRIRKGKLSRPGVFSSATPASVVWDSAIEAAALIIQGKGRMVDAIRAGIEKIRASKWWGEQTEEVQRESEKEFRDFIKAQKPQIEVTDGEIKIPHSIIRELVENGINNIEDLTDAVYNEIRDENPGIDKRDVRDAITGYGREVNQSKDEIEKHINAIKRIGKLNSKLEDVLNKIPPAKSNQVRAELSKEEKDLRKRLDAEIRKVFPELRQKSDAQRLAAFKTKAQEKIDELRDRIKRKDFNPKPRRAAVDLDAEARKLEAKKILAKEAFDYEHEKLLLAKRRTAQKLWQGAVDLVNAPKALMASADMSAPLRQGIVLLLSQNPIKSASQIGAMFRFAFNFNNQVYDQWLSEVKASPMYPLMKQSGLYIADRNAKLSAREEVFISGFLKKIPVLKQIQEFGERAYSGLLNKMRVDAFLSGMEDLSNMGIDPKTNPEEYKAWANYVNNATGRGSLGKFEQTSTALNTAFFSPRMIASRINILNPYKYYRMPPYARKMAIKQTSTFIGFSVLVAGLAAWLLKGDDDDETDFELDPRSSDFLKIRIGDTRVDMFGGFGGYIRAATQFATGQKKRGDTYEIEKLGEKYGGQDRIDVATGFFMNKLAPTPSFALKLATSKEDKNGNRVDKFGNRMDLMEGIRDLGIPLYLQDVNKIRREHSAAMATFLAAGSFFGMGVNTYGRIDEDTILKEYNKLDTKFQKAAKRQPNDEEMREMMDIAGENAQKKHEENKRLRNLPEEEKKIRATDEFKDLVKSVEKEIDREILPEEMQYVIEVAKKIIDQKIPGETEKQTEARMEKMVEYAKETIDNLRTEEPVKKPQMKSFVSPGM